MYDKTHNTMGMLGAISNVTLDNALFHTDALTLFSHLWNQKNIVEEPLTHFFESFLFFPFDIVAFYYIIPALQRAQS